MNKLASFLLVVVFGLQIGGIALMSGVASLSQVAGSHSQFLVAHGITAPILGAGLMVIEMLIVGLTLKKYIPQKGTLSQVEKNALLDELEARMLKTLDKPSQQKYPKLKGRQLKKVLLAAVALKLLNIGEPVPGDNNAGH